MPMHMTFRPLCTSAVTEVPDVQVYFFFDRRHDRGGTERVRLFPGNVLGPDREHYRNVLGYVLERVARPYHRRPTERTVVQVSDALASFDLLLHSMHDRPYPGWVWTCINYARCVRRRAHYPRRGFRDNWPATEIMAGRTWRGAAERGGPRYGYQPPIEFKVGPGEPAETRGFFGVELEVDDRQCRADQLAVAALVHPHFWTKGDGSLRHGVEMCSHPATEAWWRAEQATVTNMLLSVARLGFRSHSAGTCGMHAHIDRGTFDDSMHLYRFLHLVYRSPELTIQVSQRAPTALDQWASLAPSRRKAIKIKAGLPAGNSSGHFSRYEAVNMTPDTAEVRLFRGTLNPSRFYKNLEYLWAGLQFTRETDRIRSCRADVFQRWLEADGNAERYPNLTAFLAPDTFVLGQHSSSLEV